MTSLPHCTAIHLPRSISLKVELRIGREYKVLIHFFNHNGKLTLLADTQAICLGTGAADLVDLLIRTICVPYQDFILVTPPTFGLYKARADVNGIKTVQCPLKVENNDFVLPVDQVSNHNRTLKKIALTTPTRS
jgi:histidinol-phosphate/aromatic aminotransferase/cobyric acid decarboxylase-like protein